LEVLLIFPFGRDAQAQSTNQVVITLLQFGQAMERDLLGGQSPLYQSSPSAGDFCALRLNNAG
jgi:hypothetical protein